MHPAGPLDKAVSGQHGSHLPLSGRHQESRLAWARLSGASLEGEVLISCSPALFPAAPSAQSWGSLVSQLSTVGQPSKEAIVEALNTQSSCC